MRLFFIHHGWYSHYTLCAPSLVGRGNFYALLSRAVALYSTITNGVWMQLQKYHKYQAMCMCEISTIPRVHYTLDGTCLLFDCCLVSPPQYSSPCQRVWRYWGN